MISLAIVCATTDILLISMDPNQNLNELGYLIGFQGDISSMRKGAVRLDGSLLRLNLDNLTFQHSFAAIGFILHALNLNVFVQLGAE